MHSFPKTMAAGLLLLGAGLLGSSCVDNQSSVFIYGVMDIDSTQCLAQPDSTAVLLPAGTLDREFADGYQAALLVGSHLTQRGSRQQLRTETSRLEITRADMTLYGTNGQQVSFQSPATGLINPSDGTDPGLAAVFVRMVRAEDMANLGPDGQIIARVKIHGTTLGGQDIDSGDFDYPITLCTGCLVTYPSSALDPTTFTCDAASETMSTSTICFLGQDSTFPCTYCAAYDVVCSDPKQNPFLNGSSSSTTP
ncbi:MAG TPA: hypothetical protein VMI54_03660 [Polyangiaceae bacterium]|nr:hypothetical protein [Polyangiaceae bacterium]